MTEPITILFLTANPKDTSELRLGEEVRAIQEKLRASEYRENFIIRQEWAVRVTDLQGHLLRHKPHIVHFSGHGSISSEIILEDINGRSRPITGRALSRLFSVLKDNIRCVVLNACYSDQQAQAIARHIDCVVGMSKAIGDSAAISFSTAFYQALGFGRDIKTAFELGCAQIDLENLDEQDVPRLIAIKRNPEEVVFVPNADISGATRAMPLRLDEIYAANEDYLRVEETVISAINRIKDVKTKDAVNEALVVYLMTVPEEDENSEHLLTVIRRQTISFLDPDYQNYIDQDRFKDFLLEPELIFRVKGQSSKSETAVNYEIASLLAEMGKSQESLYLLDRMIEATDHSSLINLLAQDRKAVILQNQGLYEDAEKIRSEIIGSNSQAFRSSAYLRHRIYKHYATLLRRIHFDRLENHKDEILKYLDMAKDCCDTYHIHFSKGYIYYLLGDNAEAKGEYQECLNLLGRHQEEYYLIHIKYALVLMRMKEDFGEIRGYLNQYEKSLTNYGNFKSGINKFLLNLIRQRRRRMLNPKGLCEDLAKSLTTPESLYCIQEDIRCILEYFEYLYRDDKASLERLAKLRGQLEEDVFSKFSARFKKFSSVLHRGIVDTDIGQRAVAVRFKIHSFSRIQNLDSDKASNLISSLEDLLRKHISYDFDDLNFYGDGYTFSKRFNDIVLSGSDREFTVKLVDKLLVMFDNLERACDDDDLSLGVGIGYGMIVTVPRSEHSPDSPSYFFGEAVSMASEMCDLAKPSGIAIHYPGTDEYYERDDLRTRSFEEVRVRAGKGNKELSVFVSPGVTEPFDYRYLFHYKENERRLFINYGNRCTNNCLYCISKSTSVPNHSSGQVRFLDLGDLRSELKRFGAKKNIDEYLISLGHLNEPLSASEYATSKAIIDLLLTETKAVIQIATKAKSSRIKDLIDTFKGFGDRVVVFYSICTFKYSSQLEPNRNLDTEELREIETLSGYRNVVPYVKPFLPGITDSDDTLLEFLKLFNTIVVGYPYLSRQVTYQLSIFCLENSIENAISGRYYNFAEQLHNSGLQLSHPSLFNTRVYSFDYRQPLENFISRLNPNNEKNLFFSSPCAVAFLNGATCYTEVGNPDNAFHHFLCLGASICRNASCRFHRMYNTGIHRHGC